MPKNESVEPEQQFLRRVAMRDFLQQLCKPYGLDQFEWSDGPSVDFAKDPVDDVLGAYIDWEEQCLREALRQRGYSRAAIRQFEHRREMATSVKDEELGPHGLCVIHDELPTARRQEDMLLIDMFPLLRTVRYFAERKSYINVERYLRILIKQRRAYGQVAEPVQKGSSGGRKSGVKRRAKRDEIEEAAASAYLDLERDPGYMNDPPRLEDIEKRAELDTGALRRRKIRRNDIQLRAAQLRKNLPN